MLIFLAALAATGCGQSTPPADNQKSAPPTADQWTRAKTLRVFFAHQSVGNNILEGLKELGPTERSPIEIVELGKSPIPDGAAILHTHIGENGAPLTKLRAFREALERGVGKRVDVAILKFCFWDIRSRTDVGSLFGQYVDTMDVLKREFPSVTFVHVTVPLVVEDHDWRARTRRLLRLRVPTTEDNAKRHEFSEMIRRRYSGREPVFDLEQIESGDPAPETTPSLNAALSSDGGHLNSEGRRRAAAAFARTLATLPLPTLASR